MGKSRLLIVEDDFDISNMLRIYFSALQYDVDTAPSGTVALEKTRQNLPHLIILDIMLPDLDGFEVCRSLRTNTRTSHVPIIFLTQKDERRDKLQGLQLGGDDYITKPFDIEELKLRVQRAITRAEQQSLTDPRTGLPAGRLVEEQLRRIIREQGWALMDARINHYNAFQEAYGFVVGDDILRFTARLVTEVIDQRGPSNDFIGHTSGDHFVVITDESVVDELCQLLKTRFAKEIQTYYSFLDRQQGYILVADEYGQLITHPLMTMAVGIVSPSKYHFADIREIIELAAEARREDTGA